MKKLILSVIVLSVAASGCATKKYVSKNVGDVNQKVDNLSGEVEKTQARVKGNEARIDSVDQNSQAGIAQAKGAASEAKGAASEAKGSADAAMSKATSAERLAKGKLLYEVTISNDKVTFPVNRAVVSDDAKKMIDEALGPIVAENKGVFFEIEGHTDGTGEATYNQKLGEDRAMAVRAYLHDQHHIALSRIEVISYGEAKPVTDNKTRANRAQNRRVVIRVLE